MILLHGAGDLGALGLPLPIVLVGVCGAVPALASLLSARAVGMESRPPSRYVLLPRAVQRLIDASPVRVVAQVVAVLLLVLVIAMAAAGPSGMTGNPAPRLALIVLWGGVAAVSVLFGPVWKAVNPFRALSGAIVRFVDPDEVAVRALPAGMGVWPAVAGLAFWAWVAEAVPTPRAVLVALVAYTAAQVLAGVWFGQTWFKHGEALEVLSSAFGAVAPLGRDPKGRLGLHNPLAGLVRYDAQPGMRGFIAVVLAWELAHAVRGTEQWTGWLSNIGLRRGALASTFALLVTLGVVTLLVRAATPRDFLVAATIPMAAGWMLAHHVGPLVVDWRAAIADLADPFGRGWSLYEVSGPPIEPSFPGLVALAQILLLLGGALVTVAAAHRMSVARFDLRAARAVQFPLRAILMALLLVAMLAQSSALD